MNNIIVTDNIKIIESELLKASIKDLVIFDYDDVLIKPDDEALLTVNENISEKIFFNLVKDLDRNSIINILSIITRDMKVSLVHSRWPSLIKTLQERGVKALLLTSCGAGKQGFVESVENIRNQHLLNHGINFHNSWNNVDKVFFNKIPRKHYVYCNTHYCAFINGMIFADGADKGTVLQEFFKNVLKYKINKIIFIDNKYKNLRSVKHICNDMGIAFVGIEYNTQKKNVRSTVNAEKIKKQYELLIKEKRWVSDKELSLNVTQ